MLHSRDRDDISIDLSSTQGKRGEGEEENRWRRIRSWRRGRSGEGGPERGKKEEKRGIPSP